MSEELRALRKEVDRIDERIFTLLVERQEYSVQIAEKKMNSGEGVLSSVREQEIISNRLKQCEDPCLKKYIPIIGKAILDANKDAQRAYIAEQKAKRK